MKQDNNRITETLSANSEYEAHKIMYEARKKGYAIIAYIVHSSHDYEIKILKN
jgi:hypothetical protein